MKICTGCLEAKPSTEFSTRGDCSGGQHRRCKACRSTVRRQRYLADPAHERHHSWRAQGIDVDAALRLLAAHKGGCDLCGTLEPRGMGDWHIDHEHETGRLRGLLCFQCNVLLGKVERVGLELIQNYIRRRGGTAIKT